MQPPPSVGSSRTDSAIACRIGSFERTTANAKCSFSSHAVNSSSSGSRLAVTRRPPPKQAIIEAFKGAARNTGRGGKPSGCLLVNSVLELSPHDPEVRDFLDRCLRQVEDFFCARIEEAQREGTIRKSMAPRPTAQALLGLFLGLRVLTRGKPRKASIEAITTQAQAMLA